MASDVCLFLKRPTFYLAFEAGETAYGPPYFSCCFVIAVLLFNLICIIFNWDVNVFM